MEGDLGGGVRVGISTNTGPADGLRGDGGGSCLIGYGTVVSIST